ncbi:MAG TPA: YceI family protein [Bacteroidales bacterium]|nr:YceI family protein [Bacteroidales bacterium]
MESALVTTQTKWSIDQSHCEIAFKVKHLMIAHVKGIFKTFDASIYTNSNDFTTAEVDMWIDPSSIFTGDTKRDEHLKSPDFFDVEKHKQITFTSSTMGKPDAEGKQELWGELTILGVTNNVKLDVKFGGIAKDPYGNEKAGFTISGVIKRSDWGLVWNATLETGGLMVSNEVNISCEVELINKGQEDITMKLEQSGRFKGV